MKIASYDFLVSRDSHCTLPVHNILLLRYAEAWSMKKIGYVKRFFGCVRGWDYFVAFLIDEMMMTNDDVIMTCSRSTTKSDHNLCCSTTIHSSCLISTIAMEADRIQSYHADRTRYAAVDNLLRRKGPWTDERFQGGTEVMPSFFFLTSQLMDIRQNSFSGQRQRFW